MANIPIRGVGSLGVISDINTYDLPIEGWSDARNVRFSANSISRYSVFKEASDNVTLIGTPVSVINAGSASALDRVVVINTDYSMKELQNDILTDVTPIDGTTLSTSNERVTSTHLGGVSYVNRSTDIPIYRSPSSGLQFKGLPIWDPADRCVSLRSYKDFLIALNVTKGATNYPGMIKWSDAAQYGSPPASWSFVAPSLGGENVLNDVDSPLVDGSELGNSFIIYSNTEAFKMDYVGAPLIFNVDKIFKDDGVVAQNCAVEINNKHYVFGSNDIYIHDGFSKESLTDLRVREKLFSMLDRSKKDRCFVAHDKDNTEIIFAFPALIDEVPWKDTSDCNMAAVFNYTGNTWTFVDLPNVSAAVRTSLNPTKTWADLSEPWDALQSTWSSFNDAQMRSLAMIGGGNTLPLVEPRLYVLDDMHSGKSNRPLDLDVHWDAFAERVNIDLDEIGAELVGNKMLKRIYPQAFTPSPDNVVSLTLGRSAHSGAPVTWDPAKTFNPHTQYKYDTRNTGRYLAMKFGIPAGSYAEISGYDLDLVVISRR